MSLALREIWRGPGPRWLLAWALCTLLAGTLGPFGTFEALAAAPRFAYWGALAALALGLEALRKTLGAWQWRAPLRLASHLPYALVMAALIQLINALVFGDVPAAGAFLFLVAVVLVVALFVEGILYLTSRSGPAPAPAPAVPDPADWLLRKLPHGKRAPLVRLEAQDHYTLVVTEAGQDLLLLRFGDAVAQLGQGAGLQVHRSHWAAAGQAMAHHRRSGRDFLEMRDGTEIPVSRSFRPAAREAGLLL